MQELRRSRSGRALVLIPLGLIVAVCVGDVLAPADIHLGPLLVAAPAITAAFAGPRLTALIGLLAVGAQIFIGVARGAIATENLEAQISALVLVSALIVVFCLFRERRERQLTRSRTVAQALQEVLFPPLPTRSGPLEIACLYLAADDEATMGGDLYAAARTARSTRLLIADVRGKGLPAISNASLLLGSFRAAAHHALSLPLLALHLDGAMRWESRQWSAAGTPDTDEAFATALLIDVPDAEPVVHLVDCGHPPPVLFGDGRARFLAGDRVAPPLGLGTLPGDESLEDYAVATFPFRPGEVLLLYTDGVLEARDADGAFFPLADRAEDWAARPPGDLLARLHADLAAHAPGRLGDDAAAVTISRLPQ
ncbi:PP2C family protein-serine/threonine phosphatase [Streptomyces sp. K1PA1]|uniref:PP2C family protein-serine/threonine phosphatase n=1 Tax=Streptomyces tropicalis TaxID=3034234 RepID=A0ABT6A3N8_9ACTN|nr:PP2C family protein-serine/threonine phosphatase [Streptomyces tropicalis]